MYDIKGSKIAIYFLMHRIYTDVLRRRPKVLSERRNKHDNVVINVYIFVIKFSITRWSNHVTLRVPIGSV